MRPDGFERLLDRVCEILADDVRQTKDHHDPDAFEHFVLDVMRRVAADQTLTVSPSFHARAFPDIRADGFGIEVKFTKRDRWSAIGNSIFEGMRDPDVKDVYVIFGKIGGAPGVRWRKYADCISEVRVTNSPRFVIDMSDEPDRLFDRLNMDYDDFADMRDDEKMLLVREHARERLRPGDRVWWLEKSHSVPLEIRPYVNLNSDQKRRLRAEAAILNPEVCGSSRGRQYIAAAIYLMSHHGVMCTQTRDLFTAGSVTRRIEPLDGEETKISRGLRDIEDEMRDAAGRLDDALFEEYWGEGCPPERRIEEWLRRADAAAQKWTPSKYLFRGRSGVSR